MPEDTQKIEEWIKEKAKELCTQAHAYQRTKKFYENFIRTLLDEAPVRKHTKEIIIETLKEIAGVEE